MSRALLVLSLLSALAACGKGSEPGSTPSSSAPSATAASPYLLAADPGAAIPVLEAKAVAPKEDVVVVGRVRELLKGRAGFTFTDASVPYCGDPQGGSMEMEAENCPEPWDYCCHVEAAAKGTILVRVRDANGRTVSIERLPELRNLDLVAVKGRLVKEGDDVFLDASGWYRRERPKLDWKIDWPQ